MKSWVYFTFAIAAAVAVPASVSATPPPPPALDAILVPAVHADDLLRYDEVDRLTGAVKHTHREKITYRVVSAQNGVLSFQRDIAGKGKMALERDAAGNLAFGGTAKSGVAFFMPRQFLGDPPSPLAAGQTWQVRIPMETALGSPGTATVSVVSLDAGTRHVVLKASLRGEGDVKDMTPGDNTATLFHTSTNRQASIELSNGIIDSFVVAGDDKQSANQATPINVHIEISVKRAK